METKINSKALKAEALRLGFSACGIAPAEPIDQAHQNALKMWLDADRQAGMTYMANHSTNAATRLCWSKALVAWFP